MSAYCTLQDIRDEGVDSSYASDARINAQIALQSAFIERCTGRFFEPRPMTLLLNGRGTKVLQLGDPIISIDSLRISVFGSFAFDLSVDAEDYAVYNRHLTGLLNPDDRQNPKLEFRHGSHFARLGVSTVTSALVFPRGQQNIQVVGTFGFTDPDVGGSNEATGVTPPAIVDVCKQLVIRRLPKMTDEDYASSLQAGRVITEATRDQSYTLDLPLRGNMLGIFTGDPVIDSVLLAYKRPPLLGSA